MPVWSPDGSRVVYSSNRIPGVGVDLYQKASSGSEDEELLFQSPAVKFPTDWSADGRFILYEALDLTTNYDLWALPLEGDRKPLSLLRTAFSERMGQISPDGRWLAYTSDESGGLEVYVRPFLLPGRSHLVSTNGGLQPIWRTDGRELFYLSADRRVMAVSVESGPSTFQSSAPRELFQAPISRKDSLRQYAVSRDGERFLVNTPTEEASGPIHIVLGLTVEPKR